MCRWTQRMCRWTQRMCRWIKLKSAEGSANAKQPSTLCNLPPWLQVLHLPLRRLLPVPLCSSLCSCNPVSPRKWVTNKWRGGSKPSELLEGQKNAETHAAEAFEVFESACQDQDQPEVIWKDWNDTEVILKSANSLLILFCSLSLSAQLCYIQRDNSSKEKPVKKDLVVRDGGCREQGGGVGGGGDGRGGQEGLPGGARHDGKVPPVCSA